LEDANKELEAFSYSVSHDLRAPLRAIDSFSMMVLEDAGPNLSAEDRRHLGIVRSETQRMGKLIDDLLHFSRAGRLSLNVSDIDMEGLVKKVLEELLRQESCKIEHMTIHPLPDIRGDESMILQVWVNLLSNAFKFSGKVENPKIEIFGEKKEDGVTFWVRDNGAGFDPRYMNKLFGVFQRLHTEDEFKGTGVGLALVQRIIHKHGGKVWAESELNQGATFYFSIPDQLPVVA
jgi:light-regulated signal transduction histidine kinase (bacteriophytochrome)